MTFLTRFRRPNQEQTAAEDDLTTTDPPGTDSPSRTRQVLAHTVTALAILFVLFIMVLPNKIGRLTPGWFFRLPVEPLLAVAVLLALRPRARRWGAVLGGVGLGLLTVLKVADMGFYEALARPFDLVLDWILLPDAVSFLSDSIGRAGAIGAVIGAIVLILVVLAATTVSVLRMTSFVARHKTASARSVTALGVVWVMCAVFGVQIAPGIPFAAKNSGGILKSRAQMVSAGLRDKEAFAKLANIDKFRDTPGSQLLTGLRGKDVIVAFVESYGKVAIDNPQVSATLDAGTQQLKTAGFASRSGLLTSSTFGGGSWLGHSTFLSGLWINNEQRYRTCVSSDRLTLTSAFRRAGWRTVGVEPGVVRAWPEGEFYRYEKVYNAFDLGYAGPKFSWATMPDQYVMSAFNRLEYSAPDRGPLMAEITLVSSHSPWAPIPRTIDWNQTGNGSIYNTVKKEATPRSVVWRSTTRIRNAYMQSIEYSVNNLISYMTTYANKNTVLVFLGDHQPSQVITGENASRDVPVTIVAHDPAVLDRISSWGWQDGLKPGPHTPVWRMDTFRDKFLTAFGPPPSR